MVDSRRLYPHTIAKSVFMVTANVIGRTWRHTNKNVNRARRHFLHRARYSGAGRAMLAVTDAVTSPRDAIQRRSAAAAYNRQHGDGRLDRADGYAILSPGSIPNTDDVIALSLKLFEEKQRQIDASTNNPKKWAFLRSILTNHDLARNPELVDFALSDALLALVTNYLGTIPHLNRIDLLYSVNHGGDEAISSQIYHLDPEGTRQAKLFMNLRDVGTAEGPFTFIPASETTNLLQLAASTGRSACPGRRGVRGWWTRHAACISAVACSPARTACASISSTAPHGNMGTCSTRRATVMTRCGIWRRSTAPVRH
jgi:hypothetical protein